MRLPQHISPGAAARRSLLFDALIGAAIAALAILISAGIGVVAFFAMLCALVIVVWYLLEGALRKARRRRHR